MAVPLDDGAIHVWTAWLDTPLDDGALETLSAEEHWRAHRFHDARERRRYVAARIALRGVLARYTDQPPAALRFVRGEWGKPRLEPRGPSFSITQSSELALIAVGTMDVGADIERLREVPDCAELANALFARQEHAALIALPPERRLDAFLRCWTRKQALVKATGLGIALPLESFAVPLDGDALVRLPVGEREPSLWSLRALVPRDDYVAAVAARGVVTRVQPMSDS